ncbi:Regulator of chromosome condensation (RCC1) repeat [Musa troglodytarum]|uniref:Regulator of chromosome condensation (RCC1) repeat n=2 Tax=Musa troglodytarum TaxID=320322 RepID=A0A9E7JUJ7_9LILI|nr:Regulator of chromosome condensation (RCC1) repeat [Musa troglodytarum]URD94921.1 Regulator of chromosome condensation (RCC1) repeat [Musa troglodytarum]URD94922.1 Regulator of chromosome condensation (RCC1) repeat [Musa troglodytarum]
MADRSRAFCIEELPAHLILEILSCGRLGAADLACLEATCRMFRGADGLFPDKFRSLVEFAAFHICNVHPIFGSLPHNSRANLLDRCNGNWKRVLRFLQSVEQSSSSVETSAGNMQVTTGRYHTLLVHNSSVYSCGSNLCGVLGHGQDTTQCAAFSRINFPSLSHVIHISASHNHAAFITQSGEVFTCGDNSSFCCGHGEVSRTIFKPTRIEALKGIPCKQVATGLSFTVILTMRGQVYTCGSNAHGQLGLGDTVDRPTPRIIELFEGLGHVVQIAAGASYTFVVTDDGTVHSFGSCTNFCLGHGDQHDELVPRAIQSFKRRNIYIQRVSAGDEHALALDSSGYVYTWGRGYCGALGHGDENDKTSPELLTSLKGHLAVQVCARKRKTFVLTDEGSVFAFGWMGFGSLGFSDRGSSDKVMKPRILDNLKSHYVSQISTGLYHTVGITNRGLVFGFGDNERAQLGHEKIRGCLKPTEIAVGRMVDDMPIAAPSS